jgi:hypothetical protein
MQSRGAITAGSLDPYTVSKNDSSCLRPDGVSVRFSDRLILVRRRGVRRRELVVEGDVDTSTYSLDAKGGCDGYASRVRHFLRLGLRDALSDGRRVSHGLVGSVPSHVFNVPRSASLKLDKRIGYPVQTCGVGWGKEGRKGQYDATLR